MYQSRVMAGHDRLGAGFDWRAISRTGIGPGGMEDAALAFTA